MTAPTAKERSPSVWENLLEIFYAPAAVFERRRETPAFGLALIILAVLIVGLTVAFRGMMEPIFDAEFKRGMVQAMKQNPQLTPEMMDKGQEFARKFLYVGVGFYGLVTPLILGIILWFVGKLFGGKAQIGQTMMIGVYGMFPRVLEAVVGAAQTIFLPETALTSRYALQLGVARFLDVDAVNPLLLALVGRVDVFTIWVTVLFGIGLAVLGKMSKGSAAAAAVVVWLIGALPAVWGAVRQM